jgi:hypothetical protein
MAPFVRYRDISRHPKWLYLLKQNLTASNGRHEEAKHAAEDGFAPFPSHTVGENCCRTGTMHYGRKELLEKFS